MPKKIEEINSVLAAAALGELQLCIGATAKADARQKGFEELFVMKESSSEPERNDSVLKLPVRGKLREVKRRNNDLSISYQLTIATVGYTPFLIHYYGDPDQDFGIEDADNAQTGASMTAGGALVFDADNPGGKNRIFQITTAGGVDLHHLSACTWAGAEAQYGPDEDQTALVEGVDYEQDLVAGQIKLLKTINNDTLTPTYTSETVAAGDDGYRKFIRPLQKGQISCFANWTTYDEDGNEFSKHRDFRGTLMPNGSLTYNGEYLECAVTLTVIEEGRLQVRPD